MTLVDAHQHLWKIERGDYGWITPELPALHRDFMPKDLIPHLDATGIGHTVLVQAAPTVAETRFLLGLADEEPRIAGVVGWLDLSAADAEEVIDELADHPKLVGVRPMLQDIEDTEWVLREDVLAALAHVASKGLAMDALVQPRHLPALERLVRRLPGLPIVIDHVAKPVMTTGAAPDEAWLDGLSRLAAHGTVHCKLSGMATELGPGWTTPALAPYADAALERFGAERLMWGSDWPVLELVATYEDWWRASRTLTARLGETERVALFGGTATRFYGLDDVAA